MTASTQNLNQGGVEPNPKNKSSDPKKLGKKSVAAYVLLPGIIPQIKELTRGGFGYLALLIATVYQAVRILPAGHPYTQYANLGRFGIRQVIAEAANNVKVNRQNIDQMIIFFAVIAGILLLILQFVGFLFLLLSGDAWAADELSTAGLFVTQYPQDDIAFHMMREVFGIPDMFGTLDGGPTAFHTALHNMFHFYNLAILMVAVLIFIYYVIVVIGETAQSGTPFGQRFSHIYAPFRLVIAIGLLVPLNYGFNGSQYITLFAAKTGSGFATTGWTRFNDALKDSNPLGAENSTLIAETKIPDFTGLVHYMAIVTTCRAAYKLKGIDTKIFYALRSPSHPDGLDIKEGSGPEAVRGALQSGGNQDAKMIFGAYNSSEMGELIPYCGIITIPAPVPLGDTEDAGNPGDLQIEYAKIVVRLWDDSDLTNMAQSFATIHSPWDTVICNDAGAGACKPPAERIQGVIDKIEVELTDIVDRHYEQARKNADFKLREQTKKLGWGGAGIWYNRIAQINGAYVTATMNIPAGDTMPKVMQHIADEKRKQDKVVIGENIYEPNLAEEESIQYEQDGDEYYGGVLNDAYKFWTGEKKTTSNFFIDSMSAFFGLNGLMNIRQGFDTGEVDANDQPIMGSIHPLAKLSTMGRGLVESAIRNMAMAMGSSFLGGMFGVLSPQVGAGLEAASGMFVAIATIGLSIGFLTYYILPFLPFMYFFFAVGGWVKGIFEAMVGAPLWALAHLRIDGDGIPGKMAMNGYFLIFEIFLRPILTVFGLLGGMAIFTALATLLNELFDLVVLNATSTGLSNDGVRLEVKPEQFEFSRHIIDVFFFTCLYAVLLYMMAVSSFKMINLVPNNILRWIGQSISSFNDQAGDPTQGLGQYATLGVNQVGQPLAGGMAQLSKGAGGVGGGFLGMLNKKNGG